MKRYLRLPLAALATVALTGQSFAQDSCAKPREALALKTAALQQELMVAALYCDDAGAYNQFVLSHQQELRESDASLLGYFQRVSQHAASDNYNSYKTALANDFSLAGLRGRERFCYAADAAFDEAARSRDRSLNAFVAAQSVAGTQAYPACGESGEDVERVAGGSSALPGPRTRN
jgi:hypothetical protein